jgi:hypothetical protein
VVIDTDQPAIVPPVTAQADAPVTPQSFARPDTRIRESFAQLVPRTLKRTGEGKPKKQERKTSHRRPSRQRSLDVRGRSGAQRRKHLGIYLA